MKLPERLATALNEQVRNELVASYTYMGLASWCDANNFPGMAHWMKMQVEEEMIHVWKLYEFLNDCGHEVKLLDIPAPQPSVNSPVDAFKAALHHEEMVTRNYHDLSEIAQEEKVFSAQGLIQWFLNEQIEEEKNVGDVLDQAARMEGHPGAMMMLDRELAQRAKPVPPAGE